MTWETLYLPFWTCILASRIPTPLDSFSKQDEWKESLIVIVVGLLSYWQGGWGPVSVLVDGLFFKTWTVALLDLLGPLGRGRFIPWVILSLFWITNKEQPWWNTLTLLACLQICKTFSLTLSPRKALAFALTDFVLCHVLRVTTGEGVVPYVIGNIVNHTRSGFFIFPRLYPHFGLVGIGDVCLPALYIYRQPKEERAWCGLGLFGGYVLMYLLDHRGAALPFLFLGMFLAQLKCRFASIWKVVTSMNWWMFQVT